MNLNTDHIGDIVAQDFRTAAIFKKNGIDFCCKGGRTIDDACDSKNIDAASIREDIKNLPKSDGSTIDFTSWPLDLLADYVEKTHHRYVEEKTPVIQTFLDKLCKVHGGRHPELFQIKALFDESAKELGAHLKKEELILFPFIRNMVKAKVSGTAIEQPHFVTVQNPVHMMMDEHSQEGERFRQIAKLTDGYNPPADACNTYRVAFAMLKDFEEDLHRHIHLENNILFPKAIRLEKEFSVFEH